MGDEVGTEVGLEGHHFVVQGWDSPAVWHVVRATRRGESRFQRQAQRLLIDAVISLAHWRWNDDLQAKRIYAAQPDFQAERGQAFAVKLGWRHTIFAYISHIIWPSLAAPEGTRPPADIVVHITITSVQVAPSA